MSASKNVTNETKSNGKTVASGDRDKPSFVRYRLTEAELRDGQKACALDVDLAAIMGELVTSGYKVSVGKDTYGGGVQAFATPQTRENPNWGWTLTARAPDCRTAIGMLAYKHYTVFSESWPKDAPETKGETWG